MGRKEKFKEVRKFKTKCALGILFFMIFTLAGVCISDYAVNSLMKNQKRITLVRVESKSPSNLFISFLNLGMDLNTSYIDKDLENIKKRLKDIIG